MEYFFKIVSKCKNRIGMSGHALMIFLFVQTGAPGQDLRLVSATRQPFDGGAPGTSGTRYEIELKTTRESCGAQPDTIWIGNKTYPLLISEENNTTKYNTLRIRGEKGNIFKIRIMEMVTQPVTHGVPSGTHDQASQGSLQSRTFKGEALVSYRCNDRQRFQAVRKFTMLERESFR